MRRLLNRLLRGLGLEVRRGSRRSRRDNAICSVQATGTRRGRVLISYIPDDVLTAERDVSAAHTHFWECRHMARSFAGRGFDADIVAFDDTEFMPAASYDILVSARTDLERLARYMPAHCVKIAHLDTAHFLTHNANALGRLRDVRDRHGVALRSNRMVEDNWAIEAADMGCVLGNEFTADTYRYAGKPIHRIPLSSVRTFDWDDGKDFEACRDTFLWFGSGGFALIICGPLDVEPRFTRAFDRQMFHSDNIETVGWVDVNGEEFRRILRRTVATVYPSCSEGGGGSVITCMHGGLIPVVTREASVDVADFGITLADASVESIREAIRQLASAPAQSLAARARAAWEFARAGHTRQIFAAHYDRFVSDVVVPELERRRLST